MSCCDRSRRVAYCLRTASTGARRRAFDTCLGSIQRLITYFAELLIECGEDRTLRAVLLGVLRRVNGLIRPATTTFRPGSPTRSRSAVGVADYVIARIGRRPPGDGYGRRPRHSVMRNGLATVWVKLRRSIVRRLPTRTRRRLRVLRERLRVLQERRHRWVKAFRDTRRHNASIRHRDPASPAVCFYPQAPTDDYAIFRVAAELGFRIVRSRRGDGLLTLAWHDVTLVPPAAVASLPAPTLNARCLDISKSTVDRIWREVSGRGLSLDPLTTSGPMVVKSEKNATHDGRIITGPILERQPGFVYQRLVDTRVGDHFAHLRSVILDGRIVLTYHKKTAVGRPLRPPPSHVDRGA